jgi:ribonucleotide reductase beta subunit family protein with ferritin-like domain
MSDEVSMDEAANTALLLEQHIQEKMARALADFMFGDSIGSGSTVRKALDSGNIPHAAMVVREQMIFQMVHSEVFKNNMTYMVKNIIREEMTELRQMVRAEFARGIIHNTHNANRTG